MAMLSVSLFAADIMQLKQELSSVKELNVDRLHIDIMDGHFVPLFGYNNMWIRKISDEFPIDKEIHFMTYLTKEMLHRYLELKPKEIIIHVEALSKEQNLELLCEIRQNGVDCGIALSPETDLDVIEEYLDAIDSILLMSSEPGCENSRFYDGVYERIRSVHEKVCSLEQNIKINVDGGLNAAFAGKCIANGAKEVVIGRAFYGDHNKEALVEHIHAFAV